MALNSKFYGPLMACRLDISNGTFWLLGESHFKTGKPPAGTPHVVDMLREFTEIWMEISVKAEQYLWAGTSYTMPLPSGTVYFSPNLRMCQILVSSASYTAIPKFMDIRRLGVFRMLDCVINCNTFNAIFIETFRRRSNETDEQMSNRIKRMYMEWEKGFLTAVADPDELFRLLDSLLVPPSDMANPVYPEWFQDGLRTFARAGMPLNGPHQDNPLHAVLVQLPDNTRNVLIEIGRAMFQPFVRNSAYTTAFRSILNTRHTNATNMVFDRYEDDVKQFFIRIVSILEDLYIVACILLAPENDGSRAILMGSNHVRNIVNILMVLEVATPANCTIMHNNDKGILDPATDMAPVQLDMAFIHTTKNMKHLLKKFKNARREQQK